MHPMIVVTTAMLAAVSAKFMWDAITRKQVVRPLMEYLAVAMITGMLTWQAVQWLATPPANASTTRYVGVWVQLVSAAGITAVMIVSALRRVAVNRRL